MSNSKKTLVDRIMKEINKSDKEIMKETIKDRVEDFIIECKEQISAIETGHIPRTAAQLTRAERALKKAEANLENYKLLGVADSTSFREYISGLNGFKSQKEVAITHVSSFKAEIESYKTSKKRFEEILKNLES